MSWSFVEESKPEHSKTPKKINATCYITMGLLGLYLGSYQNLIALIVNEYSLNATLAGLLIALHFIGSIIAPIFFGEISDRKGNKIVVLIAFIIVILGSLVICAFHSIVLLSIGIFLIGCGFAVIEGTLSTVLSDINPKKTVQVINQSQMYLGIGAILGPLFALLVVKWWDNWRLVFAIFVLLYGAVGVVFSRHHFGQEIRVADGDNNIAAMKLLRLRAFLVLCLSMFIYVGIEEGIAFWMVTFFDKIYDASIMGTYALSGYWTGMIIGRFIASRIDGAGYKLMNIGMVLAFFSVILTLLINSSIIGFICFFLIGLGFSTVWPALIALTSEKFQENKGTAVGIMMTFGALGGATIPFLIGTGANYLGIKLAFWIFPIMIVSIVFSFSRLTKYR